MGSALSSGGASSRRRRAHAGTQAHGEAERDAPRAPSAESSRVLFLLYLIHRTWSVVLEHVDSKSARWRGSRAASSSELGRGFDVTSLAESDPGACCSSCSCSYCRMRQAAHDSRSELALLDGMASPAPWSEEPVARDKQRPPIYNPEDYATSLKKWGKKMSSGSLYELEPPPGQDAGRARTLPGQDAGRARTLPSQGSKDFRSPNLGGEEMSLRQFGAPGELLTKLRADLRLSFPSFVQEFASEPLDGVTLLLELLRNVQLSQAGEGARGPPAVRRRPLLDELACLQCLWSCCGRYPEASRRLVAGSGGVYSLAECIMSTVNKSRILALQLLTWACGAGGTEGADGHSMVSEALSTLRLRYGEPVRFRFLVGMLQSAAGGTGGAPAGTLHAAGLAFLNALLASAPTPQRKLYIQAELEQAGFDIQAIKKVVSKLPGGGGGGGGEQAAREVSRYEQQLIDIEALSERARAATHEKDHLQRKLHLLEKRVKILQEEKGILLSLEKCLKEKCCELQEEVCSLRSERAPAGAPRPRACCGNQPRSRDESSPPEDEGISSSERSLSPEGDPQRESMIYEVFTVKNETYDLMRNKRALHKRPEAARASDDEEEETTIDEVLQELRNIAHHAESERPHRTLAHEDSVTSTRHSIHITSGAEPDASGDDERETEIVPAKMVPHPPRRARSLMHLFMPPGERALLRGKPPDLSDADDAFYSSDEGSDSLLSASRCPLAPGFDFRERRAMFTLSRRGAEEARGRPARAPRSQLRRSESFQAAEHGSRQRPRIESMFLDHAHASPLQRSNSKGSRVDEIVSLIESRKLTRSLERIDEGLNSMVDIVLLSEPRQPSWPYERRQRAASALAADAPQRVYLPHANSTCGSFDNSAYSPASFIVKRGHGNAGFYSGPPAPALTPSPAAAALASLALTGTHSHAELKRALSPPTPSPTPAHKLTDMPSGLY